MPPPLRLSSFVRRSSSTVIMTALLGLATMVLWSIYLEFAAESAYDGGGSSGSSSGFASSSLSSARITYNVKRQWESEVNDAPPRLCVFSVPEWSTSLFAYFDPVRLSATGGDDDGDDGKGLRLFGEARMEVTFSSSSSSSEPPKYICVDNVPVLTFYHWCWNTSTRYAQNYMGKAHWYSMQNAGFLHATRLWQLMQVTMDPLLAPISVFGVASSYDVQLFSKRAAPSALPYFVHFLSRRVLCAAHGSFRIHYLPWSEAQRYVTPSECSFPSSPDPKFHAAWLLSPKCQLRRRNANHFKSVVVHCGQQVTVPAAVVYQVEHVSPESGPGAAQQCCVVLQADYSTVTNQIKNLAATPASPGAVSSPGGSDSDIDLVRCRSPVQQLQIQNETQLAQIMTARPHPNPICTESESESKSESSVVPERKYHFDRREEQDGGGGDNDNDDDEGTPADILFATEFLS